MTPKNNQHIDVETLDAYICGLLSKEEEQQIIKLINKYPEYQTYIIKQKESIDTAKKAGWLTENGELVVPERVRQFEENKMKEYSLRLISCVLDSAEKIIFKTIEGLGEAFIPANPSSLCPTPYKGKKKIANTHKPTAIANDDYHININESKEGVFSINLSGLKPNLDLKGVVVQLKDHSGKIIGITVTDTSGEAVLSTKSTE